MKWHGNCNDQMKKWWTVIFSWYALVFASNIQQSRVKMKLSNKDEYYSIFSFSFILCSTFPIRLTTPSRVLIHKIIAKPINHNKLKTEKTKNMISKQNCFHENFTITYWNMSTLHQHHLFRLQNHPLSIVSLKTLEK